MMGGPFVASRGPWALSTERDVGAAALGGLATVFVPPSGDTTGATDRAVIQAALSAGKTAVLADDAYYVDSPGLAPVSGSGMVGGGMWRTVVHQVGDFGNSGGLIYAYSAGASTYIEGLQFRGFRMIGEVASEGFSEFMHLASLQGTRDVVFEDVGFIGFRGDGLFVGNGSGVERHNARITTVGCFFDGVNKDNRNGLSILDCDGFTDFGSTFTRCSRTDMPGAIDIEPDSDTYQVVRDCKFFGSRIIDCGGANGGVSVYLPDVSYTTPPRGILFEGVLIQCSSYSDPGFYLRHSGDATAARNDAVTLRGCKAIGAKYGLRVNGLGNWRVEDCDFDDTSLSPVLGSLSKPVLGVMLRNTWSRIGRDNGSNGGNGVCVYSVDHLHWDDIFVDCGKEDGTRGYAINFVSGTSSYLTLGATVISPNSKTTSAIVKSSHTFTPATNRGGKFNLVSLTGNAFEAYRYSDSIYPLPSGYVGINNSAPATFLHINGDNVAYRGQVTIQGGAGNFSRASFYRGGTVDTDQTGYIGSSNNGTPFMAIGSRNGYTFKFEYNDTEVAGFGAKGLYTLQQIAFTAVSAASVDNNALFKDSADGKLKFKDNGGTAQALY